MRRLPACLAKLLVTLLLVAALGPARAERFVIGVEDIDYAPIMSTGPGGEFKGYVRELLDLFARRRGHSFEYRALPTKRLTSELLAGHLDGIFPDNPNWRIEAKRGVKLTYSEPAVPFRDAVMVPPAQRDQPLRTLGIVRGFTPKRFLLLVQSGRLSLNEAGDPSRLIRMALAGRVDGVHVALPVALYQLEVLGQRGALVPSTALPPSAYEHHYRLSSVRHAGLVTEFDRFLHEEQEALAALQRRYGLDDKLTTAPR